MKNRKKYRRIQIIVLITMLGISLALLLAAFTNDVADAKPKGPIPQGWWYRYVCTGCNWDAQGHCPPPDKWKFCVKEFCETVGGEVVCTPVDSGKFYCC